MNDDIASHIVSFYQGPPCESPACAMERASLSQGVSIFQDCNQGPQLFGLIFILSVIIDVDPLTRSDSICHYGSSPVTDLGIIVGGAFLSFFLYPLLLSFFFL